MEANLPLDQMTVEEKLRALELIWEDLCRKEMDLPMPQWHAEILELREAHVEEETAKFIDWEESKRRIHKLTS